MLERRTAWLGTLLSMLLYPACAFASEKAEHVVVVVWDGLRPEFVTPENTPTLYALSQQGVFFLNHHAVYPTSTEVNGASLATGAYPRRTDIVGNREYRPGIEPAREVKTEELHNVIRGDRIRGNKYLGMPTIAETLQRRGYPTAVAGTKGVALFQDRTALRRSPAARNSVNVFAGKVLPLGALEALTGEDGNFPRVAFPNSGQDDWTTAVLTKTLWKERIPKFSLLWLSEPDYTQHHVGTGSDAAYQALQSSDKNLAKVLTILEQREVRNKTDVFVVSDHGFSTISRALDLVDVMSKAGLKAVRENPRAGDILVVGNGGSALFYVSGRDPKIIKKLVGFLQDSDFAGPIFTRQEQPGCFKADAAHINSPDGPDVIVSLRWSSDANMHGIAGLIASYDPNRGSDGDYRVEGNGHHASLSSFDIHNTLIAAGPDFASGLRTDLPSGNIDLAPTILHLLGVKPDVSPDGRILWEALRDSTVHPTAETTTLEARAERGGFIWHQYLRVSRVGNTVYFDEGNGGPEHPTQR